MADKIPFDEDALTLIMGLGGPQEPGQHGSVKTKAPGPDAVAFATQIRDLCEEFLRSTGKDEGKEMEKPEKDEGFPKKGKEEEPEDMEEE